MMAAGDAFGWDEEFPVLVVTAYDNDRFERDKQFESMREFERFDFKQVVQSAQEDLSIWESEPPPDILTQMKDMVEQKTLSDYGASITVEVECKEVSGGIRLYIYLINYNGVEEERNAYSTQWVWLDDMFDMSDPTFDVSDYY